MADKEKPKVDRSAAVWLLVANAPDGMTYRAYVVLAEDIGPCPKELEPAVAARARELGA